MKNLLYALGYWLGGYLFAWQQGKLDGFGDERKRCRDTITAMASR